MIKTARTGTGTGTERKMRIEERVDREDNSKMEAKEGCD
jgi:hypothetical protein